MFSNDPVEVVNRFGGQWATSSFSAGDALVFGMYMLHGSLENTTNQYRISCDTRYQLRSEPADDRWIGDNPKAHDNHRIEEIVSIADLRKKWGI